MSRALAVQVTPQSLNNAGRAGHALGDRQTALTYYEQALPLTRAVGDRAGEAVTRYNIAALHAASGDLAEAIAQMEIVVDLDRAIGHPDLAADQQVLDRYRSGAADGRARHEHNG